MSISWSGYSWTIRDSAGLAVEPGPNIFNPANVIVDGSDKLHLSIVNNAGVWSSAQVYCDDAPFGYGRYSMVVDTDLHDFDLNVVLGFFTYDGTAAAENYRSIPMEVAKFGQSTRVEDMQVKVYPEPATWTTLRPGASTLRFTWTPGRVLFEVLDATGTVYFSWTADENVQKTGAETLGINFWLNDGIAPADGLNREVVLSSFSFEEFSMAFGTLTLGRLTLTEDFSVEEKSSDGRFLTLSGQEAMPPLSSSDEVRRRGEGLLAMNGMTVNALFTAKTDRNGFYRISDPSVRFYTFENDVTTATWSVTLERLGDTSDVEFESRLIGGARTSAYAGAGATAERWHAPPIGHSAYHTGTTVPSLMTRTGEDGAITVYRNVPAAANPRWGITPSDYLRGAPKVTVNGVLRAGLTCPNTPTNWSLSNGLIKVEPRTTTGTLRVSVWDPAAGAWDSAKVWDILLGTTSLGAFGYVTILRNDPEECVIRLTRLLTPGKTTVDLTLKRGSRFVSVYVQRRDSGTIEVKPYTVEAATDSAKGYLYATANDANGNRFVVGSHTTFTATPASGSIKNTTAALAFGFFIGSEVNGTTAVAGDTADDIAKQYLGMPAEETRLVRR